MWALSSAGRAPALQAGGHRFKPCSATTCGLVVQLVRMPACHAGGRGSRSLPGRQFAQIAQSVEQRTENPRVGGSIPPLGTKIVFGKGFNSILPFTDKICGFNSVVECHLAKEESREVQIS